MLFDIIVADPPWLYNDQKNNDPAMGGITYPTLSLDDISSLKIPAADNCALFLWATMPLLQEALHVMQSWGFTYTTTVFVWVKLNPSGTVEQHNKDVVLKNGVYSGLGHWCNGNAELVLFGKKGKPIRKAKNIKQIIFHPRTTHSKKPEEIQDRIEQLIEGKNRLELFARRQREDWVCLGNEITGNDIRTDLQKVILAT